jgi:hypothetical protein
MNKATTTLTKAHLLEILSIKLSEEGKKIITEAFHFDAIAYANSVFDSTDSNAGPWATFRELCIDYSRQYDLPINYQAFKGARESTMLENQVHRQILTPPASVSSPSSRKKTYQQGDEEGTVTRHASPVKHDEPKITPHFIDLRFWGPKR